MKKLDSYLIKILGMATLAMPLALDASAEISLKNVQIQNCTPRGDQCVTVRAAKADVSAARSIYFMKDLEVEMNHPQGPFEKSVKPQGYLDFENNQLVLQSTDKDGNFTEEVFNLTTLQKQVFVTRK